jgi:hypothetical protein
VRTWSAFQPAAGLPQSETAVSRCGRGDADVLVVAVEDGGAGALALRSFPPPQPMRIEPTARISTDEPMKPMASRIPSRAPFNRRFAIFRSVRAGSRRAIVEQIEDVVTALAEQAVRLGLANECVAAGPGRQSMSRRSTAQRLSSWRLESWSLRSTALTWASTVFGEIESWSATSL